MYKLVESKDQSVRNFYTLVEQIGEGAFGVVYKAIKKDTG